MIKFILGIIVATILFAFYPSWKDKITSIEIKEYTITVPLPAFKK